MAVEAVSNKVEAMAAGRCSRHCHNVDRKRFCDIQSNLCGLCHVFVRLFPSCIKCEVTSSFVP